MNFMQNTNELATSAPPPMAWDDYQAATTSDWLALLNSAEASDEAKVQHFLETHPSLVPGSTGIRGMGGHGPFLSALISQPRLPDFSSRHPDFMWITRNSMAIYAVLIEIEAPTKRIFTNDGLPRSEFTAARHQLAEWKRWASKPANRQQFLDHYRPPHPPKELIFEYVLIYGRRSEFEGRPDLEASRQHLMGQDEYLMSFDRLAPAAGARDYMTARSTSRGYFAVSAPATMQLGPVFAHDRALLLNKEAALDNSPYLSSDRRAFLKERFAYWDNWTRGESRWMNSGDRE